MIFKDLKPGLEFYILNKDTMLLTKCPITTVSTPHIESKLNNMSQLVVDITISHDGKPVTYVTPDNSTMTYCDGELLTGDKITLINEIKSLKSQQEQLLASVGKSKEIISKCDDLISELDDVFREKKENDERLSKLEHMMQSILDKLTTNPTLPTT